ncbi:hypothetical protein ACFLIN_04265 [Corynebacterium kutscheri]|uniref:Uncharacterized protein n=1 Tax=Corynebacterium kutscheri TaxID=35755 RepID=A0A0F6TEY1_9CORY|nr:hypothetical protein [Corynebacterium kutscheri]AKE42211.1 hypothetical protein UL82_10385 [Corynebacterium kutscheri]VEH10554.1 ABC-type transporter, permease component [Corynebacterium kutscheri]
MNKIVGVVLDFCYRLVLIGLAVGAVVSIMFKVSAYFPELKTTLPISLQLPLLGVTLVITSIFCEKLAPLRAITTEKLLYFPDSLSTRCGLSLLSYLQVGVLGGVTFLVSPMGMRLEMCAVAVFLRVLWGTKRWQLPRLIGAGRKQTALTAPFYILDSELLSGAYAQIYMHWRLLPWFPLIIRRLFRRGYLLFSLVLLFLWSAVFSFQSPVGSIFIIYVGGVILNAGLLRCTRYHGYGSDNKKTGLAILLASDLLLVGLLAVETGINYISLTIFLMLLAIFVGSIRRSRPRRTDTPNYFETGFGLFSPDLFRYYTSGFGGSSILVVASLYLYQIGV